MTRRTNPPVPGEEEYSRLLVLLDERRFEEAHSRGRLLAANAGTHRSVRAKAHNLLCWLAVESLKAPGPEALYHGEEAVRLARSSGDDGLLARSLVNLAAARFQAALYAQARATYAELQELLAGRPRLVPGGPVMVQLGLSHLELLTGTPEAALAHLKEAARLCRALRLRGGLAAETTRRTALALLALGQEEQAAQVLEQVTEQDLAGGGHRSLWWKSHLMLTRCRLEFALGHWVTARTLATNTLALAQELGDGPVAAESLCLLALVDQAEGRKEAPARARTALMCALGTGRRDVADLVRSRLAPLLTHGI